MLIVMVYAYGDIILYTVDGERFTGLNIRGFSDIKFSRKYFCIALAISTHYLV